jgi:cold shock CspA family protein
VFVHIAPFERAGRPSMKGRSSGTDVVSERGKLAAANLQNA